MALTIISMPKRPNHPGSQRGFVTDREARQAARLAGLDYRLSGRSGASKLPTGVRVRLAGDKAAEARHRSAPTHEKSGPAYVVGIGERRFEEPVLHSKWRKLMADRK